MTAVLFVVTGADHWTLADGSPHPTGYWGQELAEPHRLLTEAGFTVAVATPGGVTPTVDKASLTAQANGGQEQADEIAAYLRSIEGELKRPLKLEEVDLADYDAVLYPGGHGPMEDLAVDAHSGRLLTEALDSGKPVAVLCHAPAALLAARREDGSWPFAGYRMTGFSNEEETAAGLAGKAKWLLEDRLVESGADYSAGPAYAPYTVADRNLRSGQNPASSADLARELIDVLKKR